MHFGLSLVGLPAREILTAAARAESWGFDAIYVPDHWVLETPGGGVLDDETPSWEATTILGAIAGATSRARIGALVHCNLFRHPATTAQAIATLDHLSQGRALLGLGAGWTKAEFHAAGVAFPDVKTRLAMLDEALQAIVALWTEKRANFAGTHYRLTDAISVPKPLRKPHPPVMVGGGGKGLLAIAARRADMVNIGVDTGRAGTIDPREVARTTDSAFRAKAEYLRAQTEAAGRDPAAIELSSTIFTARLADNAEEADEFATRIGGFFGLSASEVRRMPIMLVGTADEWVEELERRREEWGLGHYVLSARLSSELAETFAKEIAPRLK